jgi:hypothetical protein
MKEVLSSSLLHRYLDLLEPPKEFVEALFLSIKTDKIVDVSITKEKYNYVYVSSYKHGDIDSGYNETDISMGFYYHSFWYPVITYDNNVIDTPFLEIKKIFNTLTDNEKNQLLVYLHFINYDFALVSKWLSIHYNTTNTVASPIATNNNWMIRKHNRRLTVVYEIEKCIIEGKFEDHMIVITTEPTKININTITSYLCYSLQYLLKKKLINKKNKYDVSINSVKQFSLQVDNYIANYCS